MLYTKLNCQTQEKFLEYYNAQDVLILADCWKQFRKVAISNFKLDPSWFVGTAGLSWNAGLKFTGMTLELIQDDQMITMLKHNIRGGISGTFYQRHCKANNKY